MNLFIFLTNNQKDELTAYLTVTRAQYNREQDTKYKTMIKNDFRKELIMRAFVALGWIERRGFNQFVWNPEMSGMCEPGVGINTEWIEWIRELTALSTPVEAVETVLQVDRMEVD
jgi:hypothetical protein